MKKVFHYLALAVCLLPAMVSCSDENNEPQSGVTNHIYLSLPGGTSTLAEGSDEALTVDVTLSYAPSADLTLKFEAENDLDGVLTLTDNTVSITAGSTTGSFTISARNATGLTAPASFSFKVAEVTPAGTPVDIKENVTVTVNPASGATPLTPELKALVETWKTKYGIDITPWLGNIKLSGSLQFPGSGTRDAFVSPSTLTLSGSTLFNLSTESTEEMPVLNMDENPMGLTDYLYRSFLRLTVDDREYFALEDEGSGLELMELLNWNATSQETFGVTLPGLRITSIANGKANVEFVSEGERLIYGTNGQPIYNPEYDMNLTYNYASSWIPFNYTYSAWSRQLDMIANGVPSALELLTYGVSAAPATYLGISDVLEDAWEVDEEEDGVANLYVRPSGVIDFNAGTMTFTFPFDHADQYGYSRVTVVYSLK